VAVLHDISTFDQIEQALENCTLGKLIKENDTGKLLDLKESREYYRSLSKKD
jgi:hypothetical protein